MFLWFSRWFAFLFSWLCMIVIIYKPLMVSSSFFFFFLALLTGWQLPHFSPLKYFWSSFKEFLCSEKNIKNCEPHFIRKIHFDLMVLFRTNVYHFHATIVPASRLGISTNKFVLQKKKSFLKKLILKESHLKVHMF